ncbi:MAG: response regulator [Burkholderiales bacterium]|nr:response regulator [Burkholderiales bacterium]
MDSAADTTAPDGAGVLRVLVVEDLPRVQTLLRELIDEPGRFEVQAVADTESQAIAQYRALQPDAVVIDLSLREGTGLGVIQALRRGGPAARRPLLIVLTNHAFPVLEAACRNAGADHFLDKSRDVRTVRLLLEQARQAGAAGAA